MFPDEFWVEVTAEDTFECPFCRGKVAYKEVARTGYCMDCMSAFHEYDGTPRFGTDLDPYFDMMKVWAEKGELVVWMEKTEERRRVLGEINLRPSKKE
nr:hypothetical protein [uncultured Desulfobulbus sp.]